MKRHVEPSVKARQAFFLGAVLICGLAVLLHQLPALLPPISKDAAVAIEQTLNRSLIAAIIGSVFFGAFILVAFYLTRRAVESGQWPPVGMPVPFRYPIQPIENSRNAWLIFAALACMLSAQIAMPWYGYFKQRAGLQEIRHLLSNAVQPIAPSDRPQATLVPGG